MRRRPSGPPGKVWCSSHKTFLPWQNFSRRRDRKWMSSNICRVCDAKQARAKRHKQGKQPRPARGRCRQIDSSTGNRRCAKCKKVLELSNFWVHREKYPFSYCKSCSLKIRKPSKPEYSKKSRERCRREVLAAYGGKCACCGETESVFLAIDHVNNDGAKHRRQVNQGSMIFWIRRHRFPKDRFQLLCYNCNRAKFSLGHCPHSA